MSVSNLDIGILWLRSRAILLKPPQGLQGATGSCHSLSQAHLSGIAPAPAILTLGGQAGMRLVGHEVVWWWQRLVPLPGVQSLLLALCWRWAGWRNVQAKAAEWLQNRLSRETKSL